MFDLIISRDINVKDRKIWAQTEVNPSRPKFLLTLKLINILNVGYAIIGFSENDKICECKFVFVYRTFSIVLVKKVCQYVEKRKMHLLTETVSTSPVTKLILSAGGLRRVVTLEKYAVLNHKKIALLVYES